MRRASYQWPPRPVVRRSSGLRTLESTLQRSGLGPVAGVDEAGRGACAGPLVIGAAVLKPRQLTSLAALNDSKKLSAATRDRLYATVTTHAVAWSAIVVDAAEIDRIGIHVANIEGMRRAVAALDVAPGYVLSDGFMVPGLAAPSLPVIDGDAWAACIAAASIIAKVTRDRIMIGMHEQFPQFGFDVHKGYSTADHMYALDVHGPSEQHRMSYRNVRQRAQGMSAAAT